MAKETRSDARVEPCEGPSPTMKGDLLPPLLRAARRPIASRPGGRAYGDINCIETRRSLLPGRNRDREVSPTERIDM